MPRDDSPYSEPQMDAERPPEPEPVGSGDVCECCLADGVHRKAWIMDPDGWLLCRLCYRGLCGHEGR